MVPDSCCTDPFEFCGIILNDVNSTFQVGCAQALHNDIVDHVNVFAIVLGSRLIRDSKIRKYYSLKFTLLNFLHSKIDLRVKNQTQSKVVICSLQLTAILFGGCLVANADDQEEEHQNLIDNEETQPTETN